MRGDGEWGLQIIGLSEFRLTQNLNFAPPSTVTLTDSPIPLTATTSSGLSVTYRVVSGPATVSGNLLTLTGEGTVVVRAEQAGNPQFTPAAVEREITVLLVATPLRLVEASPSSGGRLSFRLEGPRAGA